MRTVKYTFKSHLPQDELNSIELSTEIILDNDDDAFEEGRKAAALFGSFLDGLDDTGEEAA